jgi:hypothetical protein
MRGRAGPFAHTHVEPGGSALQPTGCRHRATNLEGQSEPGPRMSAAAAAGRSVRSLPRGTDAGTLTLYSCLRLYQGGKSDETVCHDGHGRAHRDWGVCSLCECRQLEQPEGRHSGRQRLLRRRCCGASSGRFHQLSPHRQHCEHRIPPQERAPRLHIHRRALGRCMHVLRSDYHGHHERQRRRQRQRGHHRPGSFNPVLRDCVGTNGWNDTPAVTLAPVTALSTEPLDRAQRRGGVGVPDAALRSALQLGPSDPRWLPRRVERQSCTSNLTPVGPKSREKRRGQLRTRRDSHCQTARS